MFNVTVCLPRKSSSALGVLSCWVTELSLCRQAKTTDLPGSGWQIGRRIKAETPLAVTLSLGERSDEDLMSGGRPVPTVIFCVSKLQTPISMPLFTRSAPDRLTTA